MQAQTAHLTRAAQVVKEQKSQAKEGSWYMPTPPAPHNKERPSTYFVQDRSNEEELARLHLQDQLITAGMGGVLPEQPNPTLFHHVLDIGCGTGGWLIEVAKTYPTISRLVGVDISKRMVDYAREQAKEQQVDDRVEFAVMDALLLLEFPPDSFDLVNQRLASSFLRTWDWPKLLSECQRVTRAGGVVRITECDIPLDSSSESLNALEHLLLQALYHAGHFFSLESNGLTKELARLLQQHGLRYVQTQQHPLLYRGGTLEGQTEAANLAYLYRTLQPFLRKWTRVPDDYQRIYQQMLQEVQRSDFLFTWPLLTAWGTTP